MNRHIPLSEQLSQQGQVINAAYRIFRVEPLLLGLIQILLLVTGLAFFVCLAWTSLRWLTSGGDNTALDKTRTQLTNCLVGLMIASVSLALIYLLQYFFGLSLFPAN